MGVCVLAFLLLDDSPLTLMACNVRYDESALLAKRTSVNRQDTEDVFDHRNLRVGFPAAAWWGASYMVRARSEEWCDLHGKWASTYHAKMLCGLRLRAPELWATIPTA